MMVDLILAVVVMVKSHNLILDMGLDQCKK